MRNWAALAILAAISFLANAADRSVLSVLVFDYAGVRAHTLAQAMHESERILQSAGVESVWTQCPTAPERLRLDASCRENPGPLTLVVKILPHRASRLGTDPNALGFAVAPEEADFGAYACVFYDRIQRLGPTVGESMALGHVIAHELGHLLLGAGNHAEDGIMKATWHDADLMSARRRGLVFTASEGRRMLDEIERRVLAASAFRSRLEQWPCTTDAPR